MIYDYTCNSCKEKFQIDLPMNTPIKRGRHINVRCPYCRSRKVKKKIHRAEIIFKGNGFYSTDSTDSTDTSTKKG